MWLSAGSLVPTVGNQCVHVGGGLGYRERGCRACSPCQCQPRPSHLRGLPPGECSHSSASGQQSCEPASSVTTTLQIREAKTVTQVQAAVSSPCSPRAQSEPDRLPHTLVGAPCFVLAAFPRKVSGLALTDPGLPTFLGRAVLPSFETGVLLLIIPVAEPVEARTKLPSLKAAPRLVRTAQCGHKS